MFNILKFLADCCMTLIVIIGFPFLAFIAMVESKSAKEWKDFVKDFYSSYFKELFA